MLNPKPLRAAAVPTRIATVILVGMALVTPGAFVGFAAGVLLYKALIWWAGLLAVTGLAVAICAGVVAVMLGLFIWLVLAGIGAGLIGAALKRLQQDRPR